MTDAAGTALVDGDCQGLMFDFCSQKEHTKPRAQPWKAHRSAEKQSVDGGHIQYLHDEDGAALVDGGSHGGYPGGGGPGDNGFFDLCCQKEQAKPRDQPWKAHRSAEKQSVDGGHLQYLHDKDGAALVDGAGSPGLPGHGGNGFFDLCC
ncbi:MAG: hypothetical protein Q9195_005962 [Heterodermia aff. obscurata]